MKRLGEILLDWGVIAVSELHTGLEACRRTGGRLGTQLLKFGFVDEHALLEALSEQYGVQSVTERMLRLAPIEIRKLLPSRIARRLQAVPFGRTPEYVRVAMTSPRDPARIAEVSEVTGVRVEPYVATESAILSVISELDEDSIDVMIEPSDAPRSEPISTAEWEELWNPPQLHPDRLLRIRRRRTMADDSPIVSTFPGLAPVLEGAGEAAEHEIDDAAFQERLAEVSHRDEVGALLLRYAAHYFGRLCLFAVHRGWVAGWMARGQGVVLDDVQSFTVSLEEPSLFRDLMSEVDRHMGPIPPGDDNDGLVRVLGDPKPSSVLLLPIRVKDRTVAYLLGDNPNEDIITVPVDEIAAAVRKAGAAFEILIIRKKILS
jgi:nitroreductase